MHNWLVKKAVNRKEFQIYSFIYALCDYELLTKHNTTLEQYLQICKLHHVKIIQYRDKINNLDIQKENLKYLKNNCNLPIIINDKIDLIAYADGLHIGQEDLDSYVKNNRVLSLKLIRKKMFIYSR